MSSVENMSLANREVTKNFPMAVQKERAVGYIRLPLRLAMRIAWSCHRIWCTI